ncbi:hypothetical protein DMH25_09150 [Streptomyces sp. WAC 01325]|uniref:methyltransferase domain-containing protein n=1 Tax=Streptomyces TaxID=1883 RepID=UPI000F86DF08|nr:methyltransferase domain-containing protein [Streptomyces sp. WAC 01325]RSN13462.1 hypothetical protein DMH25_09150 [Streptomyces sp. WAC 01325]
MKESTLTRIRCPKDDCGPATLSLDAWDTATLGTGEKDVVEGLVSCESCGTVYPVVAGVLILVDDLAPYLKDHLGVMLNLPEHRPTPDMERWLTARAPGTVDARHVHRSMKLEDRYVNAFLGAHYDRHAVDGATDELVATLLAASAPHDLWATATTLFDRVRPTSALDVGSSVGGLSALLSQRGCRTLGIDTSFLSVLAARRAVLSAPSGLASYRAYSEGDLHDERPLTVGADPRYGDFVVGSGLTRTTGDPSDLTCAVNLIDLVPDPARLLDMLIAQTSADGGHVLITSPYGWSGVAKERRLGGAADESSASALRRAAGERGLKVVWEDDRVPWLWRDYSRFWRLYFVDVVLFART